MTPPLTHLALAVQDEERSRRFYENYFGFEASQRYPDFRAGSPDAVRALRHRVAADGVELVEEWEEEHYVSVKLRDPDGYVVEYAWETPQPNL